MQSYVDQWFKYSPQNPTFYDPEKKKYFANIMEKGGNAGIFFKQSLPLVTHITCILAKYSIWPLAFKK